MRLPATSLPALSRAILALRVAAQGKAATLRFFRECYAAITRMKFHRSRAFFPGDHAVLEGTLDWTLAHEEATAGG
jgi:hypothetical protein